MIQSMIMIIILISSTLFDDKLAKITIQGWKLFWNPLPRSSFNVEKMSMFILSIFNHKATIFNVEGWMFCVRGSIRMCVFIFQFSMLKVEGWMLKVLCKSCLRGRKIFSFAETRPSLSEKQKSYISNLAPPYPCTLFFCLVLGQGCKWEYVAQRRRCYQDGSCSSSRRNYIERWSTLDTILIMIFPWDLISPAGSYYRMLFLW